MTVSIVNRKSKIANRKVWRIFHFTERFELPEDIKICRKSGLQYTKRFVGVGAGDEAVGYHRQLAMLSNGDGRETSMLKGLYGDLVDMAAEPSYARRGYLLDADGQPLSAAQLARLLRYPAATMRKLLHRFESVKLLERVELPEFDLSANERMARPGRRKVAAKAAKKTAISAEKGGSKGRLRNVPENSGKFRAPLKNDKDASASKGSNEPRATHGKRPAVGCKSKGNGNGKQGGRSSAGIRRGKGQGKATATTPAAAPPLPLMPQESDDGGRAPPFVRPPGSAGPSGAGLAYGRRVYMALGYRWTIDGPEAAREIGSFAGKHDEVCRRMSGQPPPAVDAILARGLREAPKIGRREANRNKAAVWNTAMNHILAKHAPA